MMVVRWTLRRVLLPALVASVIGSFLFSAINYGWDSLSNVFETFLSAETFGLTFFMVTVVVIGVLLAALALRGMPALPKIVLLPAFGALVGFVMVYILTTEVPYSTPAIAPAIAVSIAWMLFNTDLVKRRKKDAIHG